MGHSTVMRIPEPKLLTHPWHGQGYFIGNPTTDKTQAHRLAEFYQGLSLISEELLLDFEGSGCPLHGPSNQSGHKGKVLLAAVVHPFLTIAIINY